MILCVPVWKFHFIVFWNNFIVRAWEHYARCIYYISCYLNHNHNRFILNILQPLQESWCLYKIRFLWWTFYDNTTIYAVIIWKFNILLSLNLWRNKFETVINNLRYSEKLFMTKILSQTICSYTEAYLDYSTYPGRLKRVHWAVSINSVWPNVFLQRYQYKSWTGIW